MALEGNDVQPNSVIKFNGDPVTVQKVEGSVVTLGNHENGLITQVYLDYLLANGESNETPASEKKEDAAAAPGASPASPAAPPAAIGPNPFYDNPSPYGLIWNPDTAKYEPMTEAQAQEASKPGYVGPSGAPGFHVGPTGEGYLPNEATETAAQEKAEPAGVENVPGVDPEPPTTRANPGA